MTRPGLTLDEWLRMSQQSARARGLTDLEPLLAGLAPALRTVRDAYDASLEGTRPTTAGSTPSGPDSPA